MQQPLSSILAARLGEALQRRGWQLALAESCTGGAIAQTVTDIAGSSNWFDRGFVTYSNVAKIEMLGVNQATLDRFGAVSRETALAMAAGALSHSHAHLALAVTGIAGPGGGSAEKPVGTVFIAWQRRNQLGQCDHQLFQGNRHQIREQVIMHSLERLLEVLT